MLPISASFVLSKFDLREDERGFLSQILESPDTPVSEINELVNSAIVADSEDFQLMVHCARAIQLSRIRHHASLDGNDVLTFIWYMLEGEPDTSSKPAAPWAQTDRLIDHARKLAQECSIPGYFTHGKENSNSVSQIRHRSKSKKRNTASRCWFEETGVIQARTQVEKIGVKDNSHQKIEGSFSGFHAIDRNISSARRVSAASASESTPTVPNRRCEYFNRISLKNTRRCVRSRSSPYFAVGIKQAKDEKTSPKRRLAGLVSSIPFPPLHAEQFGLVQEKLAREPFWLLIAVTFLIKTKGQMAIPVFYKVKERFPSPQQLADPNNSEEILGMIRHLGLARNRLATIRKFAAAFVNAPPTREKLYQVKKYDKRDVGTISTQCSFQPGQLDRVSGQSTACNDGQVAMDAWEIGHITQGKYTLDSWRIFCRDELLGRAEDWKGEGRGPDFQPEWTRVRPHDKELRAYLRWMWMRAGWEWDPATGERKALGCELREAVNEERVGYDDSGGLQILNRPRQCS